MQNIKKNQNRIGFVSFLQFVGVISVIFGHSMNSIDVPTIYTEVKAWIYTFHMPLFFFISGFLFSYKNGYERGYKKVISNRFSRLIIPYVIWNSIFIFPKIIFDSSLANDNESFTFSFEYILRLILFPRQTILGHTWFLFALFEMFIIAILLDKARKEKKLWIQITAVLILVNCFGVQSQFLAISDLMKNGIFFWIGIIMGNFTPYQIEEYLKNKTVIFSTLVLVIFTSIVWIFDKNMLINVLLLGIAILTLFIIVQVKFQISGDLINFVSLNSFSIYILHWPVIMVLRLIFYQKLNFVPELAMLINFVLGFFIPCFVTCFLRKIKIKWITKVCSFIFGM